MRNIRVGSVDCRVASCSCPPRGRPQIGDGEGGVAEVERLANLSVGHSVSVVTSFRGPLARLGGGARSATRSPVGGVTVGELLCERARRRAAGYIFIAGDASRGGRATRWRRNRCASLYT